MLLISLCDATCKDRFFIVTALRRVDLREETIYLWECVIQDIRERPMSVSYEGVDVAPPSAGILD